MASVFALLEAFNRKEAAALGFFPCATASFNLLFNFGAWLYIWRDQLQEYATHPLLHRQTL